MKVAWYIKRLRVMGAREAIHRIQEQADLYWLRFFQGRRDKCPNQYSSRQFSFCQGDKPLLKELYWDLPADKLFAEKILAGYWPALGYEWCWLQGSDWHKAPDTGRAWPRLFFGVIPYRAGNPVGDIRVAWEPARLQQLVTLALLAGDEVYRKRAVVLFERLLLSWLEENPPYRGIHYVSAMECALRLIAVCHAVDIIRPHIKHPEMIWSAVLSLVDSHASLIIRRLSLYSSAGNHTIAECAGLIYAGELFPELPAAKRWSKVGVELLEQEASRQFLPDGGGIEQAFGYHLFITDLCNLVTRLLVAKGRHSKELEKIVESATGFLEGLFSDEWQLPNVGDSDGGYALSPYLRISHKRTGASAAVTTHHEGGYSLIRDKAAGDRLIVFDHGPLGMAPSYGHGHSDCLSVFWREQGEPLLVDAGTYTYTGDVRWRHYFRGVTAHNTVSVDRQDQAVQQSAFMWSQPFEGRLLEVPVKIDGHRVLLANHSGYLRLGVLHYRALIYNSEGQMLVWDFLCQTSPKLASRELSLWWHLGGEVETVQAMSSHYRLQGGKGACLQLEIQGGDIYCYTGDENGPHGWNSSIYGEKSPITTIEARYSGNFPHEFYTYIAPGSATIGDLEKSAFNKIMMQLRPFVV